MHVDGDPNGVAWDKARSILYVADDDHDRISKWRGGDAMQDFVTLPPPARGLGGVAVDASGRVVVVRFGMHDDGGLVFVEPTGELREASGVDPKRRRVGVALDTTHSPGDLYLSYFAGHGKEKLGGVERMPAGGIAAPFLTDLDKPVGLAIVGAALFIADQRRGEILRVDLDKELEPTTFARLDAPDLLCTNEKGDLFSGGKSGEVRKISSEGAVTIAARALHQARGCAYDDKTHRLFVADRDPDKTDSAIDVFEVP